MKKVHFPSFAIGALAVALLECLVAAAENRASQQSSYDVTPIMGGIGIQILHNNTNTLYTYMREKDGARVFYKLVETSDLSRTGMSIIPVESEEDEAPADENGIE